MIRNAIHEAVEWQKQKKKRRQREEREKVVPKGKRIPSMLAMQVSTLCSETTQKKKKEKYIYHSQFLYRNLKTRGRERENILRMKQTSLA